MPDITASDLPTDIDPEWRICGIGTNISGPTLRAFKRLGIIEAVGRQGYSSDRADAGLFFAAPAEVGRHWPIQPSCSASR